MQKIHQTCIALYVLGGDWFARWLWWNWTTIEATQALVPLRLSRPQGILRFNSVSILFDWLIGSYYQYSLTCFDREAEDSLTPRSRHQICLSSSSVSCFLWKLEKVFELRVEFGCRHQLLKERFCECLWRPAWNALSSSQEIKNTQLCICADFCTAVILQWWNS